MATNEVCINYICLMDNENFETLSNTLKNIDRSWTLFIDRDGVVNEEKKDDYIHHWEEFRFYDGAKDAFRIFDALFGHIIMVTNQRGIARRLIRRENVEEIHKNMAEEITASGGRIDGIYYCADMEGPDRKPNPGMGQKAVRDFPNINLHKSIMIGNTVSDMSFGRNLGVRINIFLTTTRAVLKPGDVHADLIFPGLYHAAQQMK